MLRTIVTVVFIAICIALVILVMVQRIDRNSRRYGRQLLGKE